MPFYTHRHLINTLSGDGDGTTSKPTDPVRRTYGQAQVNARFGVKNRATLDPFLAVPMYSHKFVDATRTLPDLKARQDRYVPDFFPEELWGTLQGKDVGGPKGGFLGSKKEKRATKRKYPTADDAPFHSDDEGHENVRKRRETEVERKARIEAAIEEGENEGGANEGGDVKEGDVKEEEDDDDDVELDGDEANLSQEDDDYADEDDGGDYDAEAYFDAGDTDEYPDDEGAVAESAVDF